MDKLSHIKELIEKFYAGETSLEEEAQVSAFFREGEIPGELLEHKSMFLMMDEALGVPEVPENLDDKILSRIEKAEQEESKGKRLTFYSLSGLAAGLLIILSVYLGLLRDHSMNDQLSQYAVEDPAIAYEEIKKTLEFVSAKWNEGTGELQNLNSINRSMESIQPIQKLSSGSKELNLLGNLRRTEDLRIQ